MVILKRLFIAVIALSLLVSAIGGLAPSSAQGLKPAQDVSVVNTPTVQAQQSGPWTVGAQLAAGTTVGISGTPTVSISGTPTVNVASLPALPFDARPALPAAPEQWERSVNHEQPDIVVGDSDARAIGLTSITLTNFDTSNTALIRVNRPVLPASAGCDITSVPPNGWGVTSPQTLVFVPAKSTLHLTYPTPLVFSRLNGGACVHVRLEWFLPEGGVRVALNGFAEY